LLSWLTGGVYMNINQGGEVYWAAPMLLLQLASAAMT